jgi:hypothetical protein
LINFLLLNLCFELALGDPFEGWISA